MEVPTSVKITFLPCLVIVTVAFMLQCGMVNSQTPTPTPIDFDKLDYSRFTPEEIAKTEEHRKALNEGVKTTLQDQAAINTAHGATLADASRAAAETKAAFDVYQKAAEEQITKGNKAIAALDHVLKKLHLAKWILCGVWCLAVAFIVMQLPLAFKQYELIGGGVAIATGCTFIWLWL